MTGLDDIQEKLTEFLKAAGIEALSAYPETQRGAFSAPVVAVSLRGCKTGASGFQDYLGERYNAETGQWDELYGGRAELTFGLDLYAPTGTKGGAAGIRRAFSALTDALAQGGPEGLRVQALHCGETKFDKEAGLFHCAAEAVCQANLCAVAEAGGTFLDFEVKGERKI